MLNRKQLKAASLLDRLLDAASEYHFEQLARQSQQLDGLCDSVRRDLENLLNTRQRYFSWPKELTELERSLVAYGAPDFMSSQLEARTVQQSFCNSLTQIIKHFEPRFKEVSVSLLQQKEGERTLRLRISGLLHASPVPEPIILDSILEPETQTFSIVDMSA